MAEIAWESRVFGWFLWNNGKSGGWDSGYVERGMVKGNGRNTINTSGFEGN